MTELVCNTRFTRATMILVSQACYSGTLLDEFKKRPKTIVLTASRSNELTFTWSGLAYKAFGRSANEVVVLKTLELWSGTNLCTGVKLKEPMSIEKAFKEAVAYHLSIGNPITCLIRKIVRSTPQLLLNNVDPNTNL